MKKLPENDIVRLRHMLSAARQAITFAEGRSREELENDTQLTFAIVRALEIVGEAANYVTDETRQMHPHVVWQDIVRMRNHLIHRYFRVDLDIVWDTLKYNLPELIEQLDQILSDGSP